MGGGAGPGTDKGDGGQGVEDERGLRAGWVSWWVDQKGRRGSPETILREILHRCKNTQTIVYPTGWARVETEKVYMFRCLHVISSPYIVYEKC